MTGGSFAHDDDYGGGIRIPLPIPHHSYHRYQDWDDHGYRHHETRRHHEWRRHRYHDEDPDID